MQNVKYQITYNNQQRQGKVLKILAEIFQVSEPVLIEQLVQQCADFVINDGLCTDKKDIGMLKQFLKRVERC